ncbi:MAG: potassium channel protein [Aquificae bacterium]|nr:potassium channel protein [Aquificota bacterium]
MPRLKLKRKIKRRLRKKREPKLIEIYQRRFIEALRELRIPLLMLHTALTVGTLGYMLLSGGDFINSFYMTIITIGTIGYGEVVAGSDTVYGRIFTSFLSLLGIGVFTTSVTVIVRIFFKEDIITLYRAIRMLREIEELEGHFIVCGYDKTSAWLAQTLKKRKIEFVVIEDNPEALKYLQEHNIKYFITEEPYKRSVLLSAGIKRAKGMVVNLRDDARNIAVIVTARLLRPSKEEFYIYSFASTDGTAEKMEELGANKAFVPNKLLATRLAAYIFHTGSAFISDLFDRIAFGEETDIDILELRVEPGSPLVGKKLKEIDLRRSLKVTIIAIRKPDGELDITISGETTIEEGDTLIIFGRPKNLRRAQKVLLEEAHKVLEDKA